MWVMQRNTFSMTKFIFILFCISLCFITIKADNSLFANSDVNKRCGNIPSCYKEIICDPSSTVPKLMLKKYKFKNYYIIITRFNEFVKEISSNHSFVCDNESHTINIHIIVFDGKDNITEMHEKMECVLKESKCLNSHCCSELLFGLNKENGDFSFAYSDMVKKFIDKTSFSTLKYRLLPVSSLNNVSNTIDMFITDINSLINGEEIYVVSPTGWLAPFFVIGISIFFAFNYFTQRIKNRKFNEFKKNLEEIENIRICSRYLSKSKSYIQKSCPICINEFNKNGDEIKEFECKHKFCKNCLINSKYEKGKCPICSEDSLKRLIKSEIPKLENDTNIVREINFRLYTLHLKYPEVLLIEFLIQLRREQYSKPLDRLFDILKEREDADTRTCLYTRDGDKYIFY